MSTSFVSPHNLEDNPFQLFFVCKTAVGLKKQTFFSSYLLRRVYTKSVFVGNKLYFTQIKITFFFQTEIFNGKKTFESKEVFTVVSSQAQEIT